MHRAIAKATLVVLSLLLGASAGAAPIPYTYDPEGSAVGFEVDFGPTPIRGRMPVAGIDLAIDFDRVANSHVDVTLDPNGAVANIPFATQAMKGASVLDTANHPEIRFESTRVAPAGDGRATITGRVTLRGVTREVVLDAVIYRPPGSDPGERDDLKILISGAMSRADFGATGFPDMVGDTVRLKILAHIRRAD